jgi:hypothetical protein
LLRKIVESIQAGQTCPEPTLEPLDGLKPRGLSPLVHQNRLGVSVSKLGRRIQHWHAASCWAPCVFAPTSCDQPWGSLRRAGPHPPRPVPEALSPTDSPPSRRGVSPVAASCSQYFGPSTRHAPLGASNSKAKREEQSSRCILHLLHHAALVVCRQ